jgi:hypothetical protein
MQKMSKEAEGPQRFKLVKRLLIVAALAVSFAAVQSTSARSRYSCFYTEQNGATYWVSCGGSAGNFVYSCSNGICDDCDASPCDDFANSYCSSGSCSDPVLRAQ